MTRVADAHGAINLAQGYPDFDPPESLVGAAIAALNAGHHQYGLTSGTPNFRAALAQKQSHFMGMTIDPEHFATATCDSTEAMLAAFMTLVDPGEKRDSKSLGNQRPLTE